jgi:hypothetical protein
LIDYLIENRTEPQIQYTDYIYHSDITIRSIKDFQSEYYNSVRKAKIIFQCKSIIHIVDHSYNNKVKLFINLKDIFTDTHYKTRNKTFVELVDSFNVANGFNNLFNALVIKDLHNKRHEIDNPIIKTINRGGKMMSFLDKRTIQRQNKTFKDWQNHKQDLKTIKRIYDTMHQLINDASIIQFNSEKTPAQQIKKLLKINLDTDQDKTIEQLHAEQPKQKSYKEQWNDAFGNEKIDLSNSVLNVSEEVAKANDIQFFRSWILFNYKPSPRQQVLIEKNLTRLKAKDITMQQILDNYKTIYNNKMNVTIELENAA